MEPDKDEMQLGSFCGIFVSFLLGNDLLVTPLETGFDALGWFKDNFESLSNESGRDLVIKLHGEKESEVSIGILKTVNSLFQLIQPSGS